MSLGSRAARWRIRGRTPDTGRNVSAAGAGRAPIPATIGVDAVAARGRSMHLGKERFRPRPGLHVAYTTFRS